MAESKTRRSSKESGPDDVMPEVKGADKKAAKEARAKAKKALAKEERAREKAAKAAKAEREARRKRDERAALAEQAARDAAEKSARQSAAPTEPPDDAEPKAKKRAAKEDKKVARALDRARKAAKAALKADEEVKEAEKKAGKRAKKADKAAHKAARALDRASDAKARGAGAADEPGPETGAEAPSMKSEKGRKSAKKKDEKAAKSAKAEKLAAKAAKAATKEAKELAQAEAAATDEAPRKAAKTDKAAKSAKSSRSSKSSKSAKAASSAEKKARKGKTPRKTSKKKAPGVVTLDEAPDRSQELLEAVGRRGQVASERARFELGRHDKVLHEELGTLPPGYGLTIVRGWIRDPRHVVMVWDINEPGAIAAAESAGWEALAIRVLAEGDEVVADIRVGRRSGTYHLRLPHAGRTLRLALGLQRDDGFFETLALSGPVRMPPEGPSAGDEPYRTLMIPESLDRRLVVSAEPPPRPGHRTTPGDPGWRLSSRLALSGRVVDLATATRELREALAALARRGTMPREEALAGPGRFASDEAGRALEGDQARRREAAFRRLREAEDEIERAVEGLSSAELARRGRGVPSSHELPSSHVTSPGRWRPGGVSRGED